VRFAACTLLAVLCAVVLGGSADSARTQGGAAWSLKPVADGQKWLRVEVEGEPLYGFQVRGTNFAVTNIKSVRASGGPDPQCSLIGTPPTLACDGELPAGISVFIQLGVSGAGGSYDFALLFQPGDTNLFYVPSNQTAAPVPLGGSLGMTSATAGRVTIHNPNETQSFQQVEVAPVGFRVTNVLSPNCGISEGGGIVCQNTLAPGGARIIRFATDSLPGLRSAVLLAHGSETGLAYVQAGDPCPDLQANLARVQAEAGVLKSHIATLSRVRQARPSLGPLRARLAAVKKELAAQQRQLKGCRAGRAEKAKAAREAACDLLGRTLARAEGRTAGLSAVLPVERRLAAKLKALKRVAAATGKALTEAKAASARAAAALRACDASLSQD